MSQTAPPLTTRQRSELEGRAEQLLFKLDQRSSKPAGPNRADLVTELQSIYQALGTVIPARLALGLAREQQEAVAAGRPFLAGPDQDLTLWAHARAYGWKGLGGAGVEVEDLPLARQMPPVWAGFANLLEPLLPAPLAWGLTGHLQETVETALDSPVIQAWIYLDEHSQPVEMMLVGQGIREVRDQVTAAALSSFFALEPKLDDFALGGVIHLSAKEMELDEPTDQPRLLSMLGGIRLPFLRSRAVELSLPQSAAEAMRLLQGVLVRLQNETGFVVVHPCPHKQLLQVRAQFSEQNRSTSRSGVPGLWDHTAAGDWDERRVVTALTYDHFPRQKGALRLELSSELLDQPGFVELAEKFHLALVAEIQDDLRRRELFYADLLKEHQEARAWYNALSEPEKDALEDVWVDYEILWETGLIVRLSEPVRVPAKEYYAKNMDYKIEQDRHWLEMVRRLGERIRHILEHKGAPLQRMVAARLFDAAMRNICPTDDPLLAGLFEQWQRTVQPLLWLEWRRCLQREGIRVDDVATHHTFFNLSLDLDHKKITLIPQTVVDTRQSLVLFDRERKVQVVRDPSDEAVTVPFQADADCAEQAFRAAQRLAEQKGPQEQIRARLLEALQADPRGTAQRIVDEWLQDWPDLVYSLRQFDQTAYQKVFPPLAALKALGWLNEGCVQSAYEVLGRAEDVARQTRFQHAAVLIMRTYVECLRNGISLVRLDQLIHNRQVPGELDPTARRYQLARQLNPKLVDHFRNTGVLAPYSFPQTRTVRAPGAAYFQEPGQAQGISQGVPPPPINEEEGAIAWRTAVEAVEAYLVLQRQVDLLNPTYETRRTAFAKLVPAIEQCLATEYYDSLPNQEDVDELLTLLTGIRRVERRKMPRTGNRHKEAQ